MIQCSKLDEFIDDLAGLCERGCTCSVVFVPTSGAWGKIGILQGEIVFVRYQGFAGLAALLELAKPEATGKLQYNIRMEDASARKDQPVNTDSAEFFRFFGRPLPPRAAFAAPERPLSPIPEPSMPASPVDASSPRPLPLPLFLADIARKKRVLVVEDSRVSRRFLVRVLEEGGYEALEATNGFEAMGLVASARPDLMILDLMLPDVDGYKVLAAVKRLVKWTMPVIILTGRDSLIDKLKAKLSPSDEYLIKPVEGPFLLQKIEQHLAASRGETAP